MQINIQKSVKMLLMVMISAIIGAALLFAVRLIPNEMIGNHVLNDSYENNIAVDNKIINGKPGSNAANYTNLLMINVCLTSTGNTIRDALENNYYAVNSIPSSDIEAIINNSSETEGFELISYSRYWHGYQLFLRPLLAIGGVVNIRYLNMALQLAMMCLLVIMLTKKERTAFAIPFAVSWFALNPIYLFLSFQLSDIFYITILCCIALIYLYDKKNGTSILFLFEICGILTSYFDLLTYPLLSLGMPLILYFALDVEKRKKITQRLFEMLALSISWGIGYAGMWASKWIISSVVLRDNVIINAYKAMQIRTSDSNGNIRFSYLDVLKANLVLFMDKVFMLIFIAAIIFALIMIFKRKEKIKNLSVSAILLVCSAMPFVWYAIMKNHSAIHSFTYRVSVISVFGVLMLLYSGIKDNTTDGEEKNLANIPIQ